MKVTPAFLARALPQLWTWAFQNHVGLEWPGDKGLLPTLGHPQALGPTQLHFGLRVMPFLSSRSSIWPSLFQQKEFKSRPKVWAGSRHRAILPHFLPGQRVQGKFLHPAPPVPKQKLSDPGEAGPGSDFHANHFWAPVQPGICDLLTSQ